SRLEPRPQDDEGLDDLSSQFVGALHGRGFQHRAMADQTALHFERRDAIAARLDDIIVAALEPEAAFLIAAQDIARVIPRAAKNLLGTLRFVPVLLHHARMGVAANAQDAVLPRRYRLHVIVQ